MRVALLYPPSCDPTAPYLSIPSLTAWLRTHGVDVLPVDVNLEAWEELLRPEPLRALAARVERRLESLEQKRSLRHPEQLLYTQLFRARGDAAAVPAAIQGALATLRDRSRFYDHAAYSRAVATIEAAMRVVSAAYAPLSVDLVSYRTPFSLLDHDEIARDADPSRDPFHACFVKLADRLRDEGVGLAGISVAFPGQLQPAFSLAHVLRARLPGVHVTAGGPALTQLLLRLDAEQQARALGPLHSAVILEGEIALLELVQRIERGDAPTGVIRGTMLEDLGVLPPPDFHGLPLDRYLSPELVLPYDPTRGCYWGACAFCHYGLAEEGTARYRERPAETVVSHLAELRAEHGASVFYLSQDALSPRAAGAIARGIRGRGFELRWGTDMRPERALTRERCVELFEGGALSVSVGVESASPRVLSLIDKGIALSDVRTAVQNLARAGVAVEAMCFSGFPTETNREALETVRFLAGGEQDLSLFILGRFDLTHGSRVAKKPGDFGLDEVWQVEGDAFGTGLFYSARPPERDIPEDKLDAAIDELSSRWQLRRYPWAGALSTAHTLLWYRRFGKDAFRARRRGQLAVSLPGARPFVVAARFDVTRMAEESEAREAALWQELVVRRRRVGRAAYQELASRLPPAHPSPGRFRCEALHEPKAVADGARRRR